MKTHEILSTPEAKLAPALADIKLKELERHATKLLRSKGNADYDEVLRAVIRALPKLESEGAQRFSEVQNLIHVHFALPSTSAPVTDDVLQRITVIIMMIISKKFDEIHSKK